MKMQTYRSIKGINLDILKSSVMNLSIKKWLPRRKSRFGRPSYNPISLFLGHLLKIRELFQYDTTLEEKLHENNDFRKFCGFNKENIPSHDTFSRFLRNLSEITILKILKKIDEHLVSIGMFDKDELALDATDILSNGRNRHNLDPDAGYGYKTDKERFHGYWVYFVSGTTSEIARSSWVLPANIHQSNGAMILFNHLEKRDLCSASVMTMDGAFDDKKCYSRNIELGLIPAISYNHKKAKIKHFNYLRKSNWRKIALGREGVRIRNLSTKKRSSVERYQSTFKDILKGRVVPVRGLIKVRKYVLFACILSQLIGKVNWIKIHKRNRFSLIKLNKFI
ncbi:MAG: hypothetical protein HeimC3_21620 [Candidatus Heimdallarchaeota archaeon LC_3]|nr:MAG: hypothetical protein HeimC3_21620 [Candidatus Heimdallarchaeota archaeon LC_3]